MDNLGFEMDEMDEMGQKRRQENTSQQVDQDYADKKALETSFIEEEEKITNMLENAPNPPVVEPGLDPAELRQKSDEIFSDEDIKESTLSFLEEIKNLDGYTAKITEKNIKKFHIGQDGKLYAVYNNKLIQITRTNRDLKGGRKFLALSTLAGHGGVSFVTDFLGIKDYKKPETKVLEKLLVALDQIDKIDQNPSKENKEDQTDELDELFDKVQELAEQYSNLKKEDETVQTDGLDELVDQPEEIAQQYSNLKKEDETDGLDELVDQPEEIAQQYSNLKKEYETDGLDELVDQLQEIAQQYNNFDPEGVLSEFEPREIKSYIDGLQLIRGQLQLAEAKIASVKRNIQITEDALKEPDITQEQKKSELKFLRDCKDDLEGLEAQQKNLTWGFKSQLRMLKETIITALGKDLTLRERINILFREQGITIASILTAVGLAISTIISSIVAGVRAVGASGAVKPTPKPTPEPTPAPTPKPTPKPGITDWIKRQLWNLANILKKLGLKALAALPGILGSILSWLFNVASKAVGWVAERVWTLFVGAGVLLITYLQKE